MKVGSIAECSPLEHSAILLTCIKLPSVFKIFLLSFFEWPLKNSFTVKVGMEMKAETKKIRPLGPLDS